MGFLHNGAPCLRYRRKLVVLQLRSGDVGENTRLSSTLFWLKPKAQTFAALRRRFPPIISQVWHPDNFYLSLLWAKLLNVFFSHNLIRFAGSRYQNIMSTYSHVMVLKKVDFTSSHFSSDILRSYKAQILFLN